MKPPTAVIAEDELPLRDELCEALARLWPELQLSGLAEDGVEALHLVQTMSPDVVFLDIQMPGLTGLEVAARASGRAHVVFVTAYDEHAIAAFEQGAVDYLLKPLSLTRLAATVSRLKARLSAEPADLAGLLRALGHRAAEPPPRLRWINASIGDTVRLITVDEVVYFKADNRVTVVFTARHEAVIRRPIKELLEQLDPDVFWQIHRGTVVNANAIEAVHRSLAGNYEVRLKQRPELLSVSAPYAHRFRQM